MINHLVPAYNAIASGTLSPQSYVVLSQTLSYTEMLVYSRVLLRQKVSNLIAGLSENIQACYDADNNLQHPVYCARAITLHELLYGLLILTGHEDAVPLGFRQQRYEVTDRFIETQVANSIISKAELFTVWGMLRFVSGNLDSSWQAPLRKYCGIDAEFDSVICAMLEEKKGVWQYKTVGCSEAVFTIDAYYQILRAVVTAVRPTLTRRIRLNGLQAQAFQNSVDRVLSDKLLSKFSAIGFGIGKLIDTYIRWQTVNIKSGGICVNEHSEPALYKIVCNVCAVLCMPVPEIYIYDDMGGINAYTTGVDKPIIVLTRMAASMLDEHELAYVIGHECGHILCKHVKYHALMNILAYNMIPGGDLVHAVTLGPLLSAWYRRSELSADRAGLLACQSIEAVKRAMLKMMGTPYSEYQRMRTASLVTQSLDFQDLINDHVLERTFNLVQTFSLSHPRTVFRCLELLNWIKSGEYDMLLNATEAERVELAKLNSAPDLERAQADVLTRRLADWASTLSDAPYRDLLFGARTLMLKSSLADMYPFNTIFTVHKLIEPNQEDDQLYTTVLRIRYVADSEPKEHTTSVLSHEWSELPAAAQSHFIKYGKDIDYSEEIYRYTPSNN